MKHLYYDKRLLSHYLETGQITKADYDKYLNSLEDKKDNAEIIDIDEFLSEEEDTDSE